jgi:hypothetical protein
MLNRRGFIGGLIGLVAAPMIVRAASLMPVKAIPNDLPWQEEVLRNLRQGNPIILKSRQIGLSSVMKVYHQYQLEHGAA